MLCQDASKSLWPSRRLEIPALPLHGKSFRKGVKFSVQTTSWGRTPCNNLRLELVVAFGRVPSGSKDMTGRVVRVLSIKLRDAQKRPESAFVKTSHFSFAL